MHAAHALMSSWVFWLYMLKIINDVTEWLRNQSDRLEQCLPFLLVWSRSIAFRTWQSKLLILCFWWLQWLKKSFCRQSIWLSMVAFHTISQPVCMLPTPPKQQCCCFTSNCNCDHKQQVVAAAAMNVLDTEHATPRSCMSNLVSACLCGVHEAAAANAYTSTPHMSVRACQEGPAGLYYNFYTLHYKSHASHNQKCRPY